jgi:hypothetical protein
MNTRSRTRYCVVEIASSSMPRPDPMNIEFTEDFQKNQYKRLEGWELQTTEWVCPIILTQLSLTNDFNLLSNRVGLLPFVFEDAPTYPAVNDPNSSEYWETPDRVYFCLLKRDYDLNLTKWCNFFGSPITSRTYGAKPFCSIQPLLRILVEWVALGLLVSETILNIPLSAICTMLLLTSCRPKMNLQDSMKRIR